MSEEKRKWKIRDLAHIAKNSIEAMVRGEFLKQLKVDRYFPEIAWLFLLCLLIVIFHFGVDSSLVRVEQNKKIIKGLEIEHTQKVFELARLGRRSSVIDLLKAEESLIGEPEKPAGRLK